jgi:hypothetical protein
MNLFTSSLCCAGLLSSLLGPSRPQEPEPEPRVEPTLALPQLNEDQQEMVRLFHEVERTLAAIDVELYDASAGRIPVPEGKESGIDRLLRSHGSKSEEAVTGIERILELAEKMGGQSCGQCMKPNPTPGDGKSPLDEDQAKKRGPTQGEKTPEAPKPSQGDEPKPGESKPKPQGEKRDERAPNPPSGTNLPAAPRTDASGNAIPAGQDAERWGTLPERVRLVFQNQITDDLPLQYRDWIDSYYRRLNRSR